MIFLILIPGNIGYWKFRLHRLLSWTPERTVPGYSTVAAEAATKRDS